MEERQKEIDDLEKKRADQQKKYVNIRKKFEDAENSQSPNLEELRLALKEVERGTEALRKEEEELKKKDKVGILNNFVLKL